MNPRQLFYFIFFYLFLSIKGFALNVDSCLAPLSSFERIRYISGYIETYNIINTPAFGPFLNQLSAFAKKHKDQLLQAEVEYLIREKPAFEEPDLQKKIALLKQLQETYQKKNDPLHVGASMVAIGQLQFTNEQYAAAFENLLGANEIFKTLGYGRIPAIGKFLHDFALDYFFFQNYEQAILYMRESIKLPKYNSNLDIQRYNTLGMSYLNLNRLDSAYRYLQMAYQRASVYRDSTWMGLSAGNIGEVLYQQGAYQKALNYFLEDYRMNIGGDFPDMQQKICVNLCKVYLQLGYLDSAHSYLLRTRHFFPKPGNGTFGNQQLLEQAKLNYYAVSYQYHLKLKEYRLALLYADSLHRSEKIRDQKYNTLQVEMAAGQRELLQSKMMVQKNKLIYEKQRLAKNMVILSLAVIFIAAALLGLSVYRNKQRRNKQKQLQLSAALERTTHHLKLSELKLNEFALRVQEKSQLVDDLTQKLEKDPGTDHHLLLQLRQSTILTESDWMRFRVLFEQVHSGFLHRLKEKHPEVSPAEIRYLTLAKLHFSTKEMAAALGVSPQSIRTNWYRIRKKLELPESLTAEALVAAI
ncbi:tetratricopeptide repeat protein [Niabella pedocola]|uniref:Tetratricopeptide repeat protein n=1 Tax=Niabella pedocola TaxID=1752077 RepID=A0ABS8PYW3_9BACT|nr:tetratricopeptide repeat protein [Niabella pedocola]MCD2426070.1 tetratricopeptide repeat protein [Niabella pedocola]